MMTPQAIPTGKVQALLELLELDGLPCGCVVAAFRARPWDLAVVSVVEVRVEAELGRVAE